MTHSDPTQGIKATGRYIVLGIITVAPLVVTWFILDFLFTQLSRIGRPFVSRLASAIASDQPGLSALLQSETLISVLGVILVVALLWLVGWTASRVLGRRLINAFEGLVARIPVVDRIYKATKRFLQVADGSGSGERRVVLINFPSPEMKAVGLLTSMIRDRDTGTELAAVYVPTSPNPTSGYIEIVPTSELIFTDWSFDEAMSFVVTGGSNAPATVKYFADDKAVAAAASDNAEKAAT